MEIRIHVKTDTYNTDARDKLIITPIEDEIFLKISDSDREISVSREDFLYALGIYEINKSS
jgi:hypothetical protein